MKKSVLTLIAIWVLLAPHSSQAQHVYRISALIVNEQFVPAFEGFKKKMAELGYKEGKNVSYDLQNAKGNNSVLQRLAQRLVQEKPDLIVTSTTGATLPVAKLTKGSNLPVVFLSSGDPLQLVKSYASSGNNMTGISTAALDLSAKRLELLKELAPWAKRLIALNNPQGPVYQESLIAVQGTAKKLGFTVKELNATTGQEIAQVLTPITYKVADAIILQPDAMIASNIDIVAQHSVKEKLLLIPALIVSVRSGGLATYAPDYFALGQQGAVLVDKILKGARPTDLPIEKPYKLNLVINLKTAKAIGLKIPKEMLIRADEIVE
jgi:putative ABC transport system substrate-binding protein